MNVWLDGICNDCGCIVVETGSDKDYDYMNSCSNPSCKNFGWHHNYDVEFQDYYKHGMKDDFIPEN